MKLINEIDRETMERNSVYARRLSENVFCLGGIQDIDPYTKINGILISDASNVEIRGLDGRWRRVKTDEVIFFRTIGRRFFFDPPNGVWNVDDLPEGRCDIFTVKKNSKEYESIISNDRAYLPDSWNSIKIKNIIGTFYYKTAMKSFMWYCLSCSIICCRLLFVTNELYNAGYKHHLANSNPSCPNPEPVALLQGDVIDMFCDDIAYGSVVSAEEVKRRYYIYDRGLNGARFRKFGVDVSYAE